MDIDSIIDDALRRAAELDDARKIAKIFIDAQTKLAGAGMFSSGYAIGIDFHTRATKLERLAKLIETYEEIEGRLKQSSDRPISYLITQLKANVLRDRVYVRKSIWSRIIGSFALKIIDDDHVLIGRKIENIQSLENAGRKTLVSIMSPDELSAWQESYEAKHRAADERFRIFEDERKERARMEAESERRRNPPKTTQY